MQRGWALVTALLLAACNGSGAAGSGQATGTDPQRIAAGESTPSKEKPTTPTLRSQPATDGRLEIELEIKSGSELDRVPMRTAALHFRNVGPEPLSLYLPRAEPFRMNISTLIFAPETGRPLLVPEPRPHGYVVTEEDFHLLEPGKTVEFPQRFTIDPFALGGRGSARLEGFERGRSVDVSWTYENAIRRWEGGKQTMDGLTRELFGGKDVPWIWTGKLQVRLRWTVPD